MYCKTSQRDENYFGFHHINSDLERFLFSIFSFPFTNSLLNHYTPAFTPNQALRVRVSLTYSQCNTKQLHNKYSLSSSWPVLQLWDAGCVIDHHGATLACASPRQFLVFRSLLLHPPSRREHVITRVEGLALVRLICCESGLIQHSNIE